MDAWSSAGAFTSGQACRLTGVPYRRLDAWASSGFLAPSAHAADGTGTWRGYTFGDLVQLRVAKRLRDVGMSLPGLRIVQELLRQERTFEAPRAQTYLLTDGRDVCAVKRGRDEVWSMLRQPGQRGFPWVILDLSQTVADVREAVEAERRQGG